jgi:hypothetical protein
MSRKLQSGKDNIHKVVKVVKRDIKCLESDLYERLKKTNDILVGVDDLFGCAIIYAHCTFDEMKILYKKIYDQDSKHDESLGYCFHGPFRRGMAMAEFVWVSSERNERNDAVPTFMHEISHMADNIITSACVNDRSGEVRANIVERESRKVLLHFFGIDCAPVIGEKETKEAFE